MKRIADRRRLTARTVPELARSRPVAASQSSEPVPPRSCVPPPGAQVLSEIEAAHARADRAILCRAFPFQHDFTRSSICRDCGVERG